MPPSTTRPRAFAARTSPRSIAKEAQRIFKKQGLTFRLGMKVTGVEKLKSKLKLSMEPAKGGEAETLDADVVIDQGNACTGNHGDPAGNLVTELLSAAPRGLGCTGKPPEAGGRRRFLRFCDEYFQTRCRAGLPAYLRK